MTEHPATITVQIDGVQHVLPAPSPGERFVVRDGTGARHDLGIPFPTETQSSHVPDPEVMRRFNVASTKERKKMLQRGEVQ